jgi:isocitrate dehydrogenase (NAD+)
LGFAAGANIGYDYGMFDPVHGSAPKYTGQNRMNPIAIIFSIDDA